MAEDNDEASNFNNFFDNLKGLNKKIPENMPWPPPPPPPREMSLVGKNNIKRKEKDGK
jgi:hypothetical protein